MMDTKKEETAALFVLDLLDVEERNSFEQELDNDPQLRDLVQELSTGLHGKMKNMSGPARMDLLDGIHEKIGVGNSASPVLAEQARKPLWMLPYPWLAAAASVLVVLNLVQVFVVNDLKNQTVLAQSLLEDSLKERVSLIEENQTIKQFNETWEQHYMELASHTLPFFESSDGVGHFTVIELFSPNPKAVSGSISDIPGLYMNRVPSLQFAGGNGLNSSSASAQQGVSESSFGCSIWREDEQQGFLEVYNLAQTDAGQAPFLWVRSSRLEPYIPIGFLPDSGNRKTALSYSVNRARFTLGQILITSESVNQPVSSPSGNILMMGP